jgi:hypothetical protein
MDLNRLYVNIFLLILLAGILIYLFRPVIREGKKGGKKKGKGNPFSKKSNIGKAWTSVRKGVSKIGEMTVITAKIAALKVQTKAILAKHGTIMVPECFFKNVAQFFSACETTKLVKLKEDIEDLEEKLKKLKQ